jgi:hypothetical protein
MSLVTVVSQATAWPPTLSVPLHWFTDAPGAAAAAVTGTGARSTWVGAGLAAAGAAPARAGASGVLAPFAGVGGAVGTDSERGESAVGLVPATAGLPTAGSPTATGAGRETGTRPRATVTEGSGLMTGLAGTAVLTAAVGTGVGEATGFGVGTWTSLVGVTATWTEVGVGTAAVGVDGVATVEVEADTIGAAGSDVGAGCATTDAMGRFATTGASNAATGSGNAAMAREGRSVAAEGGRGAGCAAPDAVCGGAASAKAALPRQIPQASTTTMDSSTAAAMATAVVGMISGQPLLPCGWACSVEVTVLLRRAHPRE